MRNKSLVLLFCLLPATLFFVELVSGRQAAAQKSTAASLPPVRIILVGDSTMAINNGWGPGFCAVVVREVTCVNVARTVAVPVASAQKACGRT